MRRWESRNGGRGTREGNKKYREQRRSCSGKEGVVVEKEE